MNVISGKQSHSDPSLWEIAYSCSVKKNWWIEGKQPAGQAKHTVGTSAFLFCFSLYSIHLAMSLLAICNVICNASFAPSLLLCLHITNRDMIINCSSVGSFMYYNLKAISSSNHSPFPWESLSSVQFGAGHVCYSHLIQLDMHAQYRHASSYSSNPQWHPNASVIGLLFLSGQGNWATPPGCLEAEGACWCLIRQRRKERQEVTSN